MSKIIFNEYQQRQLEANSNVRIVTDRTIQYTPDFKLLAVKQNQAGKGPAEIFTEVGFDLKVIGLSKARSTLDRWRRTFQTYGENGFFEERRGKGSKGCPKKENASAERKLAQAKARIRLLEAELSLLKKLDELERQAKKNRR